MTVIRTAFPNPATNRVMQWGIANGDLKIHGPTVVNEKLNRIGLLVLNGFVLSPLLQK